jgi:hypothetical protein
MKHRVLAGVGTPALQMMGLLLVWAACSAASMNQELTRALPSGAQAKPWVALSGSTTYGEGLGLTEIYDGGYKKYLDNGVVEAAKRAYRKGKLIAEVTVHRMKSEADARKLAQILKADFGSVPAKEVSKVPGVSGGFSVRQPAMAEAIVWGGRDRAYLCSVVIGGRGADREKPEALAMAAVRNAASPVRGAK